MVLRRILNYSALSACLLAIGTLAHANWKIPKGIFRMDEITYVSDEARMEREPIVIVAINTGTGDSTKISVSSDSLVAFESIGKVVMASRRGKGDMETLKPLVAGLNPKADETFPHVYILSSDLKTPIAQATYEELKEEGPTEVAARLEKEVKRTLYELSERQKEEKRLAEEKAKAEAKATGTYFIVPLQAWKTNQGQVFSGAVSAFDGETVTFTLPDGREPQMPLSRLVESDKITIRAHAAQRAAEEEAEKKAAAAKEAPAG